MAEQQLLFHLYQGEGSVSDLVAVTAEILFHNAALSIALMFPLTEKHTR